MKWLLTKRVSGQQPLVLYSGLSPAWTYRLIGPLELDALVMFFASSGEHDITLRIGDFYLIFASYFIACLIERIHRLSFEEPQ